MMARYRVHAAATFLIRTFAPGDAGLLRSWRSKLEKRGERVTILFDLPGEEAGRNAIDRSKRADSARLVTIGGKTIAELNVKLEGALMTVDALLVRNSQ